MEKTVVAFNHALESWFEINQRKFPWRDTSDPYLVWISEIMSQQTQIVRVAEDFYPHFIEKFPDLNALAASSWEEVFPVWDGLGYYNRGKNCLKTAKILVKNFEGVFPKDLEGLEKLPGIGKYTASAILSFAFDQKIPAIDTNISKIISTLWSDKDIVEMAQLLVKNASSGKLWNSAMMDLASFLREGKSIEGALSEFFPPEVAQKFIPQKKKPKTTKTTTALTKKKPRIIEVGIACIWADGKYLVQSRPKGKSFVGFWEFPGGKREKGESFRDCVKREIQEEIGVNVSVRPHFFEEYHKFKDAHLCLRFHRAQIQSGTPKALENQKLDWVEPKDFFKRRFLPTNQRVLKKLQKMRV